MAKSIRSKWKRKMRAIKRVGMDEKVLIRMKKMLAAHEAEVKQMEADQKQEKKLKDEEAKAAAVPLESEKTDFETTETTEKKTETETETETTMEVEGETGKKKYKVSLRKMRNEDNKYPAWMTTKKIRKHKNLMKVKEKRNRKEAKQSKLWKMALSAK